MTETGRFSLNSILSALLFASRACIGMFLINIKFMFRPNIQCERNRGKKIHTHPRMQMLPLTMRSQKQHFQLISSSEDWRTVRVSHVKIEKSLGGLNCELSAVLWPISNLSSLVLSEVVKRCPASSQNTGATIKPHLSGAGTLGSTDSPRQHYWLNQFYKGYPFSILVT